MTLYMAAPERRVLYDLAGAEDDRRFSPYCWRTKMALAHKGLEVETVPWRFTDKEAIAFSGQERVPVLVDGERVVSDSWQIALYLEDAYPDRVSLFGGPGGQAVARFVNSWTDGVLHPALVPLLVLDIFGHLHEKDRAYFRQTREALFGRSLESFAEDHGGGVLQLRKTLQPLRLTLRQQPYLGGASPLYADYIAFGAFQWARSISPLPLLESDDPVSMWRDRLLAAFGGLARCARGYDASGAHT